jgi:hypothetical protein
MASCSNARFKRIGHHRRRGTGFHREGLSGACWASHAEDTEDQARKLADKICGLRVFEDAGGKMNLSPAEAGAELLIVSQFTLYGDCRQRRPGFTAAARPPLAIPLYALVIAECRDRGFAVETESSVPTCWSLGQQRTCHFVIDTDNL